MVRGCMPLSSTAYGAQNHFEMKCEELLALMLSLFTAFKFKALEITSIRYAASRPAAGRLVDSLPFL